MRPRRRDAAWFGETPLCMDETYRALKRADLFVAIGTSGAVHPAAGFVGEAHANGISTLEFNLDASDNAHLFDDARYGPANETVPAWVDEILAEI